MLKLCSHPLADFGSQLFDLIRFDSMASTSFPIDLIVRPKTILIITRHALMKCHKCGFGLTRMFVVI